VLWVDLNADHLACCVLDGSGNPVGAAFSIPVQTAGLSAPHRDGRVRAAITTLLDRSAQHHCSAEVVENLDFADARATGTHTMRTGPPGNTRQSRPTPFAPQPSRITTAQP
jgi:hypothetical protein